MVEAKKIEPKVTTSIKINKLKTNLSNSNKEITKLQEEKKKLEKELIRVKEKAMKKYKSSDQFLDDLADESLGVFHERFKDYRKK